MSLRPVKKTKTKTSGSDRVETAMATILDSDDDNKAKLKQLMQLFSVTQYQSPTQQLNEKWRNRRDCDDDDDEPRPKKKSSGLCARCFENCCLDSLFCCMRGGSCCFFCMLFCAAVFYLVWLGAHERPATLMPACPATPQSLV